MNEVHVSGIVADAAGMRVDGAVVTVWPAGVDCAATGGSAMAVTDASGAFAVSVERGTGPAEQGCVVVEAKAGGSSARAVRNAFFASGSAADRVELELSLPRAPELTRKEGERLVDLLARAIPGGDEEVLRELDLYVRGDRQWLDGALTAYRQYLRGITAIEPAGEENDHWMRWRIEGVAGRSVTTAVYRETLIELHGPLIDYGLRGASFVQRILDVAHAGDVERMARVLTADDEDVPLAVARDVVERLRTRFDLPRATLVLVNVDEAANALHYRVSGPSRTGAMEEAILVVGYGDGLVGLRSY